MVLAIDNAAELLRENSNDMFDLIESFLLQLHHWLEKEKPCHLCLQMERNELVRKAFAV
jgi:hypothetical protein